MMDKSIPSTGRLHSRNSAGHIKGVWSYSGKNLLLIETSFLLKYGPDEKKKGKQT